jgi:dihydrofolate reductase / thymidylate synthase
MGGANALRDFIVVVAATAGSLGIGKGGGLPWKLAGDMAYFKRVTSACKAPNKVNAVIMGRKTWESIPARFRPLAGRCNVVLSRNPRARQELTLPDDVLMAPSLNDALKQLAAPDMRDKINKIFVIGGGKVYEEALKHDSCKQVLLTLVQSDKFEDCDTHLPALGSNFKCVEKSELHNEDGIDYCYTVYDRCDDSSTSTNGADSTSNGERTAAATTAAAPVATVQSNNKEEMQYLDCVKDILDNGAVRGDRTGTGTLSKFGVQMRFSLRNERFPLLTTKRVFWRGVAEELLWFVAGSTNANILQDKGIHIWDGNGSREFLDKLGLTHREQGDLGPVYGYQWRHFGAKYVDMHTDYTGQGVDQLAECINKIKTSVSGLNTHALQHAHLYAMISTASSTLYCSMQHIAVMVSSC